MSVEAIATVLHHSRATGTAKVVLIGIANHAGDGGAWPTIATLSKYAGVSERNVQVAIRKLEELGEIHVHDQAGGNHHTQNRYRPNRYDILVVCPPDCDRSTSHRCASDTPENRGDATDTPQPETGVMQPTPLTPVRGVDIDASGVSPATPEPSYNHPDTPRPLTAASPPLCSRHPAGDGTNCRACGTTSRQLAEQRDREAAATTAAARLAEQQRLRNEAEQQRARRRSPAADAALDRVRELLAGAR